MKTVRSLEDARKLALSRGAALDIGGHLFNADRARVSAPAPRPQVSAPALPAAPAPVEQPTFTRADVERMLAENNAKMHEQFAKILAALRDRPAPAPVPPAQWDFDIVENSEGAIVHVTARPKK